MTSFDDEIEQRQALLDDWVEVRREIAALEARAARLLADRLRVHELEIRGNGFHRDAMNRSMFAEFSAAARSAQGSVERAFVDAHFLDRAYPVVATAFEGGGVTAAHVHEIIEAGHVVREAVQAGQADDDALRLYEVAALVIAETETPTRTRARLRELAAALAGETIVDRHRRALSERSVTLTSVGDGLALLQVVLPEHLAVAILDRLTQMAREVINTREQADPVLDLDVLDDGEDPVRPCHLDPSDPRVHDSAIFGESGTFTTDPLLDDDSPDLEHPRCDERGIDEVRADLAADLLLGADPITVTGTAVENI